MNSTKPTQVAPGDSVDVPLPPMKLTVTDDPGRGHYYTADQMQSYAAARVAAALAQRQGDAGADDLRAIGLMVAVHNDYRLNGEPHTFWLFTDQSGMSYKGEGKTDAEALNAVRATVAAHPAPSAETGGEVERTAHDAGIIKDLEAMAANKDNGFWPQALAIGALRMVLQPAPKPTPAAAQVAEPGDALQAQGGQVGDAVRQLVIGKAIERACAELPMDFEVEVMLERNAGTVRLCIPEGFHSDEHFDADTFDEQISNAIDAAIAAAATKGGAR